MLNLQTFEDAINLGTKSDILAGRRGHSQKIILSLTYRKSEWFLLSNFLPVPRKEVSDRLF